MVPSPGSDPGDDRSDGHEGSPSDGTGDAERFWNESGQDDRSDGNGGSGPADGTDGSRSPDGTDGSRSPDAASGPVDDSPEVGTSPDEGGDGDGGTARPSFADGPGWWVGRRVWAVIVGFSLGGLGFLAVFPYVIPAGLILGLLGVDVRSPIVTFLVGFVILQGLAFPTVAVGYLSFRRVLARVFEREIDLQYVRIRIPSLADVGWTVGGYVAVFALVILSMIVVSLLDAPTAQRSNQAVFQNPGALLWMIPISFLLIGPGEELLFRGIIQDRLRESFSAPSAILLASAAFAPLHIFALSGGIQALATTIAVLFVPSLVFGITYEATDNLTVPILIHGAYDATIFGGLYVGLVFG